MPASADAAQSYGSPAPAPSSALETYGRPAGGPVQPYAANPLQPFQPGGPASAWAASHPHHRLVPPGGRLGALLLDMVLALVTLYIGWFIWAMISWQRGQTPGKQLLGHVVADATTAQPFTWGQMFLRDFCIRGLLFGLINAVTFGIFGIVDACTVFGTDHRTYHDRMANSVVRYADV